MFKRRPWLPCLAGLALLVHSCDTVDGEDAGVAVSMPPNLLCSIALANGGRFELHEPIPGELVAIYVGRGAEYREVFEVLERGATTHVHVYEALSGRRAPAVLVEAEARSIAARTNVPEDAVVIGSFDAPPSVAPPSTRSGTGAGRAAPGAGDLIDDHGPSGWGFMYRWTSRTGSGSVTRDSLSMYTHLDAYDGPVVHEIGYEDVWGNMVTYVSKVVPQGSLAFVSRSGLWTTRRTRIRQAGGGYHVSIFGTN